MNFNEYVAGWRKYKHFSVSKLADDSGLDSKTIEAIERGEREPTSSDLQSLSKGLGIPTPWLFHSPKDLELLWGDLDDSSADIPNIQTPDPVTERILRGTRYERELYVLLTALIRHGDPKLLRAAEVNLRSLLKQSRAATVPWQSRPSGHFEPPSD